MFNRTGADIMKRISYEDNARCEDNTRRILIQFILAFILSFIINLSIQIMALLQFMGRNAVAVEFGITSPIFISRGIFLTTAFFVMLTIIQQLVNRDAEKSSKSIQIVNTKNVFWRTFLLCIISWGICFLTFFPGAAMNDTINGIESAAGAGNMQPFLYQIYVHCIFALGQQLFQGNGTLSFALLTIIQILLCAFFVAYSTKWLAEGRILGNLGLWLYAAFFAFFPIIADYSITIVKDVPFSFSLLLVLPLLYDVINKRMNTSKWALFAVGVFVFWFSRSNGKYAAVIIIILLILLHRVYIKQLVFLLLALLIIDFGSSAIRTSLNPYNCSMREASGVLLNQISAVAATGGTIDEEDARFLNEILPYDQWASTYQISFVDTLKFSSDFHNNILQENKGRFLKTWFRILLKNPETYFKAYILQTYGLWSVMHNIPVDYSQSLFTSIHNNVADDSSWAVFMYEQKAVNKNVLPAEISSSLKHLYLFCLNKNMHIVPGIYLMILLLMIAIKLLNTSLSDKTVLWLLGVDLLIFVTEMAAVPASFVYRYSFYLIVTIPLLLSLLIADCKQKQFTGEEPNQKMLLNN